MLQDIRQNTQGPAAKIVVGIIVLAFAGFGLESILLGGGNSGIAEVNGEDIAPQEVQQMVNTQRRQLIAMLGEDIDPALLDEERLSNQALQSLIGRRLLGQSAEDLGLSISEGELGRVVGGMDQFRLDGQFSPELYKNILSQAGYTPRSFKAGLEEDLVINQLQSGLGGSEFATPQELALAAGIAAEQRDIRYLTIPFSVARTDTRVTDEQVEDYYREHEAQFYSRETVVLDYIELRPSDFHQPVDEDEVLAMYEQEKDSYQYQTENRVSHILLTRGEDESEADYAARIAEVEGALEGVMEGDEDFAAVAGRYSDDVGSAGNGGDLGYSAGDAFPEAMEEAVAELETGVVSAPVETDAGTHFLLVTDRREGEAPSLEQMRPELEQRIRQREASKELVTTVEELRDLAFNAENLDGPAEQLGLEVQRSEPVERDATEGLFSSPALQAAIFSEDVLELGHNSQVVEVGGEHFVAAHVARHNPPALRPLEEVREEIVAAISDEQAREAVSEQAQLAAERIRGGESVESVAKDLGYEWQIEIGAERGSAMLPADVSGPAFRVAAPAEGESSVDFALNAEGDARVFQVSRVVPGDFESLDDARQQRLRQQVGREYGALVQQEYQQGLRAEADIIVY